MRTTESGKAIKPRKKVTIRTRWYGGLPVEVVKATDGVPAGSYVLDFVEDGRATISKIGDNQARLSIGLSKITAKLDDLVVPDDLVS